MQLQFAKTKEESTKHSKILTAFSILIANFIHKYPLTFRLVVAEEVADRSAVGSWSQEAVKNLTALLIGEQGTPQISALKKPAQEETKSH